MRDDEYFALGEDDEDEFSDHDENDLDAGEEDDERKEISTKGAEESKESGADVPMLKK